ncbi:chloride channel protein [Neiella marina]|uniref:Chloride channel protein n=1 Tax=Neiella holothuriorum TaxID=2870530 RepID=A0ABS7EFK0_9GAMM|nr:chloride channel protein [Neiella holothuriorum]MBW8191098.1 chloride channel protein [Neiella holothuriorum]
MNALLHSLRQRLATPRASWQLTLLGLIGGLGASILIVSFISFIRFLKEVFDQLIIQLPVLEHAMPLVGAAIILLIAISLGLQYYRLGIPFVIYRIRTHNGSMPLKNTINQFIGASIALASGFVVGREGPAVHLGAAGSGLVGWWLKLPNNATRVLSASGIAAGIAATFNTPLGAVVFVMEVVLKEYKMHMVLPVLLAAACGAIAHHHLNLSHEFDVALEQLPAIGWQMAGSLVMLGVVLGLLSVLFAAVLSRVTQVSYHLSLTARLLLAGGVTGVIALLVPELTMTETEAVMRQLDGSLTLELIAALFIGKLVACSVALGLGIPGGIIGPLYAMGALATGCFLALLSPYWQWDPALTPLFIIIGMGSMMAASLHAPMAAMVAIMELTNSPDVIVPAMLVMIPAQLMVGQIFNKPSMFVQQMQMQGMSYEQSPIVLNLQKTGALAMMETNFQWLTDIDDLTGVKGHVLAKEKGEAHDRLFYIDPDSGERLRMEGIDQQSSLAIAYQRLRRARKGAVYIYGDSREQLLGIITWQLLAVYMHKEVA